MDTVLPLTGLELFAGDLPGREARAAADPRAAGDEDAGWMRQVAEGEATALRRLFEKWKLPLLSFFYRALGSRADAEDLTLEVFVRLHRAAADYRPTAKFSTYLFHIAHNLLRNERRRQRRKPAEPAAPEAFDYLAADQAAADRRVAELEEVFQRALLRLPERARAALLLLHQQGLGYGEAAAVLGVTENALRVLVHRARQQLKQDMEEIA